MMDIREKQPSEKRLIDREALLSSEKMDAELCATCGEHHTAEDVIMMIKTAPTVDAVPVVRCRECKHRGTDDCIFHIKGEPADEELLLKLDNDFCSYGERKGCAD